MSQKQLLSMDPNMLLSIINMKLRNEFDNEDKMCDNLDIEELEIIKRLKLIGYVYNKTTNQFISDSV